MLYLGLDLGSLTCDAVLLDDEGRLVSWAVVPTGARHAEAMARARAEAVSKAGCRDEDIAAVVSTGYGRERVEGRLAAVTEITCHARGITHLLPGTEVLLDIGGQDSKAIRIAPDGKVADFAMNDRCAAGTGRFLEVMARALEVEVADLGELDAQARGNLTLTSLCTVFAESEVVGLVAAGTEVPEIVRGLHRAIASRAQALVRRVARDMSPGRPPHPRPPTGLTHPPTADPRGPPVLAMSGGVARNRGVVRALSEALGWEIGVPPEPDIVGALGAALIALERAARGPSRT